ncbi:hypothetical protein AVEN_239769-1 [Araneus ventricosus]|uniref:Integrase catalytic domain-containing protein n=1 Tax=Araneus ventricosus TaxID=182803 RepID=A0A4Y2ET26_ARAVE|nr:hypothetical protein AVEN_239769-1 [Araneus ventricosus]
MDILEPIEKSDWATPIVPVIKPDGSVRICGDFKVTLNSVLEDIDYPLPRMEDIFAKLSDGKCFSKIDLSRAYLHMEWPEVYPTRSLFCRYGLPKTFILDNDSSFISNEFQTFLKNNGIYRIKTSPYFPSSNGQAEGFVQTFKDAMRQAKIDFGSKDYKLQKFLLQYRKTPHSTTHQSPAMMFLGRDIRIRLDLLRPNRNGTRVCPTGGTTCCMGGECNEIGLKFSPDYYLSTTVEYPVQIFSLTRYKIFPDGGGGTASPTGGAGPPLAPPLRPNETPYEKATDSPVRQFEPYVIFQTQRGNGYLV